MLWLWQLSAVVLLRADLEERQVSGRAPVSLLFFLQIPYRLYRHPVRLEARCFRIHLVQAPDYMPEIQSRFFFV